MKWFEDIFTKSKLMIISGILSIACYFTLTVTSIIYSAPTVAQYLILAVLLITANAVIRYRSRPCALHYPVHFVAFTLRSSFRYEDYV